MKTLSLKVMADTMKNLRSKKRLSQEKLSKLTGINRIMIGKIEKGDFIPSIGQLEQLSRTLGFDIADLFVEKEKPHSFAALRSEAASEEEAAGVDFLISMMLDMRKHLLLRRKHDKDSGIHA